MKEFKMYADIVYHDSFQEFMEGENVGAEDFILTNEFLYNQYVKPLNPNCGSLFIEAYGKGEPTTEMVDEIKKAIPAGVKRLIAVGGGSVIDIAKMCSLHVSSNKTEDLFDLSPDAEKPTRIYEVYAIPTTCGTGSEVTNACAVELSSLHTKRGLNSPLMFPAKSVLIPELISGLPYKFFATSSIDALIHATESYLSPKASPVSELFSKEAIRLIFEGYQYIVKNGLDKWTDRAQEFINASNFAGLAFCSAGCAAVHALSYPLGGGYHIPHGEANQLVFAATFRKYKEKQPVGKINDLEKMWGDLLGVPADQALEAAFQLFDQVQPRKPLKEFGISDAEFQGFAEGVMAGQTRLLNNNYVPLTIEDMVEIYKSVY
ncbi:iron-containing alcohol dehydrogenase [Agathobaculum sp. NSJ-28]|uniref:Iron-containing alcohol dehydrogenase n=2 Tax=Agathobaculum TaxID=2048137 RepID=A0A923RUN6_9FIRM|nr:MULTISPECIES: iron-containing alcohol dehydrogenase [Agathobaculum]MBC5724079.1 iron-containing alcohol dehydrogenase [Agathobaculum faecis]MBS6882061.1 iron-containing alcohol dehydrogenase [Clostridiaceae bacterium]MCU6787712.1 iron-containing alcohol dehydrogenase [Agathobaculum ammoniilyticum]SCI43452.1 Ethanolamine utilization protein EutG [uncultured Butyricicoccus sp.]